ncbi:putative transcription factor WD40-like family [Helianthus annuus]|uniref:Putative transducin/WD40 repeat-like superfamily protein n=1 Tax=Helianthus annuus TaxID=4232 RepID=A0A251RTI7_HELAN|nr:p21-activated protein kinase-interacting protein 1-like [Helianthus annuus]KAF5757190.1 putative transcription factor WD40-like family [Helianthus annuus]KAJ0435500.1 putative transcription factor WD40-like family [Helianthus annuus]KAJ0637698.1 putative transcription factor WD40-like family [Helianthus annuus]KAJ0828120.1 putative transcription factor WD40-like family [Helianthus annuus]
MSLVAGSYERFIWGFKLKTLKHSTETLTLSPLFSFPSHLSPIKSVAVAGSVAVSGGSDDTIKIYDLSTSSEIGSLNDPTSTVTSLVLYTPPSLHSFPRNLFSAYDDGHVSFYDADPFVHLKTLKVHKKGVNDMSVHPSGKLGLTVGRDECLGMINLVRGRRSFFCKLGKEAEIVEFGCGGDKFFMGTGETVSVHEAEDAKLVSELKGEKRVLCLAPATNGLVYTGGEDRNLTAWDTISGKVAYCIEDAHSARLKGIVVLSKIDGTSDEEPFLVASASSDGIIRVWDVRMAKKDKPTPLAEANTKSRLTCLAGSSFKSMKKRFSGSSDSNKEQDEATEQ